jgi:hypothetical protein
MTPDTIRLIDQIAAGTAASIAAISAAAKAAALMRTLADGGDDESA